MAARPCGFDSRSWYQKALRNQGFFLLLTILGFRQYVNCDCTKKSMWPQGRAGSMPAPAPGTLATRKFPIYPIVLILEF